MIRRAAGFTAVLTVAAATPAAADIGPFRGAGTGLVDRYHHMERQSDGFYSDSSDKYTGRFVYAFSIDANGNVRGRGQGVYNSATWHLSGNNPPNGAFGCDVPIRTAENYVVDISGQVLDGNARVRFELAGAEEVNEDHDCGAGYTAFATRSTYFANSLRDVQGDDPVSVDVERPRIGPLRLTQETGGQSDKRVILNEWEIGIRPPDRVQDTGPDAPPGTSNRPPGRGSASICTIEGTARADRLNGTRGNDVICGFGGNDRINGRGGHDLVYAGPGNDRVKGGGGLDTLYGNFGNDSFATRDGRKDKAHGGAGTDSARVDRRDTTPAVERVSGR